MLKLHTNVRNNPRTGPLIAAAVAPHTPSSTNEATPDKRGFVALTIGSIGVVYGDIGTSPLYALEAAAKAATGGTVTEDAILGVLSLIIWALIIVVTLKYVLFLLNADNRGEGGTLSLMALAQQALGRRPMAILALGVAGAALFYGDALITPAISVISAVEGLGIVAPSLKIFVVPLTVATLVALFAVQSRGTGSVAAYFGPVMLVWFVAIAVVGSAAIMRNTVVFEAFDPRYGMGFLGSHGLIGIITLGAVFLAVTGAEALYADLGHFGKRPIQTAWLVIALPALTLNYLGQGALILAKPGTLESPFYGLVPGWALPGMIALATAATIIASQAVITGAYSLTRQAMQLGLLPRFHVRHTSECQVGQIYLPQVNLLLLVGVISLVILFRSSTHLATAYGIAVTGTMVVTCCLAFVVVWKNWNWPLWAAVSLILPFLAIDTVFLGANSIKIVHGGWVPVLIAALLNVVMFTWVRGTRILAGKVRQSEVSFAELMRQMDRHPPHRVSGTAVFLTSDPDNAPLALLHSLKHFQVLHEHNLIVTVRFAEQPHVHDGQRAEVATLSPLVSSVVLHFGYMDHPNVPRALVQSEQLGRTSNMMSTSFILSRRALKPSEHGGMPLWQDCLFIGLVRNASDATSYFCIPTGRAIEVGTQLMV